MRKDYIILCVLILTLSARDSLAQGIRDSLFSIQPVAVKQHYYVDKEHAGTKETQIDSFVLQARINNSLATLLSENSQVHIKNYGRGALSTAAFRGTAPSHTQVSWNGIAINSPMSGMVDFSLIPVYLVDKLSIQHGAASIPYQSGGLGGHINLESKVDWANKVGVSYIQDLGSFRTHNEYLKIGLGTTKLQSKTRFYHSYSANNFGFANQALLNHPWQVQENADYRIRGMVQEISLRTQSSWIFSGKFWFQDAERSLPLVMSYEGPDSLLTKENEQKDQSLKAILSAKYYSSKIRLSILSGTDIEQLDYQMTIKVRDNEDQKPVNSGSTIQSYYNRAVFEWELHPKISALVKGDYNLFKINTLDSTTQLGYHANRNEFSLYTGIFVEPVEKLQLSLNLRKQQIQAMRIPWVFSLGSNYKPFKSHNLLLKTSFAKNFHAPSLNHLYWQPGGNPNLKPEKGYTLETGVYGYIQNNELHWTGELTAYYSDISDWILWLPGFKGYWEPVNVKNVRSQGLELSSSFKYSFSDYSLKTSGNYTLTQSLNHGDPLIPGDESVGRQLPFIPVHAGNILMQLSYKKWFIQYQYQYTGIRHLLSSNRIGLADDSNFFGVEQSNNPFYRLYAQQLSDLALGKYFILRRSSFQIEFKVNNLLNETYRNILNRYMPERHYSISLKFDFSA